MPDLNDFYAYKSTSGNSGGGNGNKSGNNIGCAGWIVIAVVLYMLIFFISNGASFDAIDTLLGLGFLAFLFARAFFR